MIKNCLIGLILFLLACQPQEKQVDRLWLSQTFATYLDSVKALEKYFGQPDVLPYSYQDSLLLANLFEKTNKGKNGLFVYRKNERAFCLDLYGVDLNEVPEEIYEIDSLYKINFFNKFHLKDKIKFWKFKYLGYIEYIIKRFEPTDTLWLGNEDLPPYSQPIIMISNDTWRNKDKGWKFRLLEHSKIRVIATYFATYEEFPFEDFCKAKALRFVHCQSSSPLYLAEQNKLAAACRDSLKISY